MSRFTTAHGADGGTGAPGPQGPTGPQGPAGADANTADFTFAESTISTNGDMDISVLGVPGEINLSAYAGVNIQTYADFGLTANKIITTSNGATDNIKIGDDAWIGDGNVANNIVVVGQQDSLNGGIVLGERLTESVSTDGSNLSLNADNDIILYPGSSYAYLGTPTVGGETRIATRGYVTDNIPVIPITSMVYVDFKRSDSYLENGSRNYPYKTLADAYTAASAVATSSNPITIVLLSSNTTAENVTFSKGHIFLTGENSSGTHSPIVFTGSLTFTGPNTSISENHFAISGIELVGVSGTPVIVFSGSYQQRLFLKDVWVTANGSAHGVEMTNTGTGSSIHTNDSKFSHNGTGHYHCIHVAAGTANLDSIETSGATVGVIGVDGGTCNLSNSDLQGSGSYVIDVYAGGVLSAGNVKIQSTAANSSGIKLNNSGALAVIGNITFNVPATGTGRAIEGVTGSVVYYGPMYFLPDGVGGTTNTKVNPAITALPISNTMSRS